MKNSCPYCLNELQRPFPKKGKCPFCYKYIFVRNGNMVTEFDSNKIDWLRRVEYLGVTSQTFEKDKSILFELWHTEPSFGDICWSILNELIGNAALKNPVDYINLMSIYLEMAHILDIEGKDSKGEILIANNYCLLDLKQNGYHKITTRNCNDEFVCGECIKMAAETIPIDMAIQDNPIPNRCKNDQCRCGYHPVLC